MLRYRVDETEDGLHGEEGTFTICSFWLVAALSEIGEADGRGSCARSCSRSPARCGLYAEEIEPRSRAHLGNFPQAFTHLALINAVAHVIADEQREGGRPGRPPCSPRCAATAERRPDRPGATWGAGSVGALAWLGSADLTEELGVEDVSARRAMGVRWAPCRRPTSTAAAVDRLFGAQSRARPHRPAERLATGLQSMTSAPIAGVVAWRRRGRPPRLRRLPWLYGVRARVIATSSSDLRIAPWSACA